MDVIGGSVGFVEELGIWEFVSAIKGSVDAGEAVRWPFCRGGEWGWFGDSGECADPLIDSVGGCTGLSVLVESGGRE